MALIGGGVGCCFYYWCLSDYCVWLICYCNTDDNDSFESVLESWLICLTASTAPGWPLVVYRTDNAALTSEDYLSYLLIFYSYFIYLHYSSDSIDDKEPKKDGSANAD